MRSGAPPPHGARPASESSSRCHSAGNDDDSAFEHHAERDRADDTPVETEQLVAVHAAAHDAAAWVVAVARWRCGYEPPDVGPAWITAPRVARAATLVVLGEAFLRAAGLDVDMAAELDAARLKRAAGEMSALYNWSADDRGVTPAELQRRRAEPGRLAHQVDPEAVRRWVETGDSGEGAVT